MLCTIRRVSAPAEKTCQDERLVKDKISDCCYFSGVTSHLIGSKMD